MIFIVSLIWWTIRWASKDSGSTSRNWVRVLQCRSSTKTKSTLYVMDLSSLRPSHRAPTRAIHPSCSELVLLLPHYLDYYFYFDSIVLLYPRRTVGQESCRGWINCGAVHQDIAVTWIGSSVVLPPGVRSGSSAGAAGLQHSRLRLYDLHR